MKQSMAARACVVVAQKCEKREPTPRGCPDVQRITNVITKILRGIYWIEFDEMLADNKEIKFTKADAKDPLVADAMRIYGKSKIKRKSEVYDEDIFRYFVAQPDDEDNETCWIMVFYDVTVFVGSVS